MADPQVIEHTTRAGLGVMGDLAIVLALSLVGGLIASRLRLPAIVGFLVAGALCGPHTPGFVADAHLAEQFAEVGVVLLMFGVGLHFSFKDLMAVRNVAVAGALVQSLVATAATMGVVALFGWGPGAGLVLGLALSVASTVVLVRALVARDILESHAGRIAVGWLVVEDLFSALVLVLLPILAVSFGGTAAEAGGRDTIWGTLVNPADSVLAFGLRRFGPGEAPAVMALATVANVAIVVGLLPLGRRFVGWLMAQVERTGSSELFTLATTVVALFLAFGGMAVFGLSVALGAFFAGIIVGGTRMAHRVTETIQTIRDLFGVLFFASVGMLFDPATVLESPGRVLAICAIIVLAKPVIAAAIALALRQSFDTALTIGAGLAQIGEFSFILATLGLTTGLLPGEAYQLVITGAIASISLNPVVFWLADAARGRWAVAIVPAPAPVSLTP
jgi:CPA2 family monovalent cation:H+ antiporter-2